MKKLLRICGAVLVLIGLSFFYKTPREKRKDPLSNLAVFKVEKHEPFVVLIPSYNNEQWCERNVRSALDQKYPNFRVVFVDDASTDATGNIAKGIAHGSDRFTYVRNKAQKKAMANIYEAIHSFKDEEIVVLLDGDDWLAHDRVLTRLNEVYADPSVWVTYGSYVEYPSYRKGDCSRRVPSEWIEKGQLRSHPFLMSHLKTFRAGLFKKIGLQKFLFEGAFLPASSDLAFMTAMIEMAGTQHSRYVRDILYIYNRTNPLSDDRCFRPEQEKTAAYIRQMEKCLPLKALEKSPEGGLTDLVVFSFDRPLQLYALLESIEKRCQGMGQIGVICRCSDEKMEEAYQEVVRRFPQAIFWMQGESPEADFKPLLLKAVFESPSPYIVFAVDDNIITDAVDLKKCTQALEERGAYGFYLRLGKNIDRCYMLNLVTGVPPIVDLNDGTYAWQFSQGEGDWKYPNTVDLTIYRKSDIEPYLRKKKYHNPNTFELAWASKADFKKVGLCFDHSKVINIPLNLVNISGNRCMHRYSTQELLEKFKEGLKIDINQLYQIPNQSPHISHEVVFIHR